MACDTIAAIATPYGMGGIGVVRVSGPLSKRISQEIFRPHRQSHPLPSHRFCYGQIVDPITDRPIDEAMLVFMKAPRTYTREDCLELQAHGGIAVLRAVLKAILGQGARLAAPGEFTLRAFLNGRIDLPQAEAVVDLIQAHTETGAALARRQMTGELSAPLREALELLLDTLSLLEGIIDFPEDLPDLPQDRLIEALNRPVAILSRLHASFDQGTLCREGAAVIILGAPNVGKSSLLNAMVGCERAIVTDLPGTTRDIVEGPLIWRGLPFRALDTVGLRRPADVVEAEGYRLLRQKIDEVDLIIFVLDTGRTPDPLPEGWEELIGGKPCIVALNKIDLPCRLTEEDIPPMLRPCPAVRISARDKVGIDALLDVVQERLLGTGFSDEFLLTNERHRDLIERALSHMDGAASCLRERADYVELCADEVHRALRCIRETLGEEVDACVLSRIFERFCIGK